MEINKIIGNNIRFFREKFDISQQKIADYLGVKQSLVSYYECGERKIPLKELDRLANLFGVDSYDFYEENAEHQIVNVAFAFRDSKDINVDDLKEIADFRKIIKNYLSLKKVLSENESSY